MALENRNFNYKLKDSSDLCHYILSSENDHGVQCIFLRENNSPIDITQKYTHLPALLFENRLGFQGKRDVVFLTVSPPAKGFDLFDHERKKIVVTAEAYFKILQFFQSDWPLVKMRLDSDYEDIKTCREWITLTPNISFRGPADIVFQMTIDETCVFTLNLVVTRSYDSGQTNIQLIYTDDNLGSIHLPSAAMCELAKELAFVKSLYYDYKNMLVLKQSRQS